MAWTKHWTPADTARANALRQEGRTASEASALMGWSTSQIKKMAGATGWVKRRVKSDIPRREAERLASRMHLAAEIAAAKAEAGSTPLYRGEE